MRRLVSVPLAVVVMALALAACAGTRDVAELRGAEYVIRRVEFEGVERFEAKEIHDYMALRPREWLPPRKHWYYPGLIPADAERIVELYQNHGYYEAEVVDVEVEIIERKTGHGRVDLRFVIDEGPVTTISDLDVRWSEGEPEGPPANQRRGPFSPAPTLDVEAISNLIELEHGQPFEVPAVRDAAGRLRQHLRGAGFPYAEVTERASVDRDARTAKVELEVVPGPFMTIGAVTISGLEAVPEPEILNELDVVEGEPFSPSLVELTEQRAYGLDVFSTVSVEVEDENENEQTEGEAQAEVDEHEVRYGSVGLDVRVVERDPQRIRLGAAIGFEPTRWEQRLSARYSHDNLFGDLYRLSLTGRVGYAELPNLFDINSHGPIARLEIHGEKKGLLEDELVWTVDPELEVGIEQGYEFFALQHRFGLSRFFTRWFELELSHTLRYVDFYAMAPGLTEEGTFLGLDFRDPYVVSYVGTRATVFAVDNISAPNDGAVFRAEYKVAGGPFGGDYDFHELALTLRGYWRPIERLQLAARVQAGMIFPFGDQPGAPIDLRRYLGGAETVRGWGRRRLAPRVELCPANDASGSEGCRSVPVGGKTSALANLELRVRTWRKLWAAAFLDIGDVQPEVASFVPREWNYALGGGLRYDTPIGKVRFDVGFRLNETALGRGEPIYALHLGLGESF